MRALKALEKGSQWTVSVDYFVDTLQTFTMIHVSLSCVTFNCLLHMILFYISFASENKFWRKQQNKETFSSNKTNVFVVNQHKSLGLGKNRDQI